MDKYIQFFKTHEKVILTLIVALVLFGLGHKAFDSWALVEKTKAEAAAKQAGQVVKTDTTTTVALEAEVVVLQKALIAQNALLQKHIQNSQSEVKTQQQADANLSIMDRAKRIAELAKVQSAEITPSVSVLPDHLDFSPTASLATVQQLELVPSLQSQLSDANTIIKNDATIIDKQGALIAQLETDLDDEKKSHSADVKAEKAKARGSFWRGFKAGAAVGFGTATAIFVAILK